MFQGCQPFLMPPCIKTYECSTTNSKVPECWEDTCKSIDTNFNRTEQFYDPRTKIRSKYKHIYIYCSYVLNKHFYVIK